jgi:hypothetical protein
MSSSIISAADVLDLFKSGFFSKRERNGGDDDDMMFLWLLFVLFSLLSPRFLQTCAVPLATNWVDIDTTLRITNRITLEMLSIKVISMKNCKEEAGIELNIQCESGTSS